MNKGTCRQLETRLAALHEASLELVRNLRPNDVLERIVKIAREQTGADYAALGVLDEEGELDHFIHLGMNQENVERIPHLPKGLALIGNVLEEDQPIRIAQIEEHPQSQDQSPQHSRMSTFLGVPILSDGHKWGQLYLANREGGPAFSQEDEELMETLVAYAAVTIENSRLYAQMLQRDRSMERRFGQINLLNTLAQVSSDTSDMDVLLEETLDLLLAHFDAQAGEIFLRDEDGSLLWQRIHRGEASEAFESQGRFMLGEGLVGRVAQKGTIRETGGDQPDSELVRPALLEAGFAHLIAIPLVANNIVIGSMTLASLQQRQFAQQELDLLKTVGAWAGTAIENARLQRQSCRIAVQEERERIGMDLHDGIVQSIYAVGLALDYARISLDENIEVTRKKLNESMRGLNDVIKDIRAYILDLRPRQLRGGESLSHGIQSLLDEFRANTNVKSVLTTSKNGLSHLSREHALTLFHVCQESLANVAKHAHANKVEVKLWHNDGRVLLKVADDGRGFDTDQIDCVIGHGLSNMRRRVRKVGGEVEISSALNEGTTILAWVPRNGIGVSPS